MAIPIIFNAVNVNGQYTNATVSIGENVQNGWNGQSKNNFGSGPSLGMNLYVTPFNYIADPDLIDAAMTDPEIIPTFENQQF